MTWPPISLLLLLFTLSIQLYGGRPDCEADVFVLEDLEKQPRIASPDGRYGVVLTVASENDEHGEIRVYQDSRELARYAWDRLSGGVFVKWADDSRAVYVMWSNGGRSGGYELRAFRVDDRAVQELPLSATAEAEFDRKYPCETRGHNVYPRRWLKGSREILLTMEVYPAGDCGKNMGVIRGYRVRATDGAILERYSEKQLKALAPPTCPAPIYPTGLWGSDDLAKAKADLLKKRGG
jgi:hypothetical protein